MLLRGPEGTEIWLAYGMNVHPGGTLASFEAALERTVRPLRARLGASGPFGLALRFGAAAFAEADDAAFARVGAVLRARALVPFTGNAFVLGDFDGRPLKDAVYLPPWSDPARRAYTLRFAACLAAWSPSDRSDPLTLSTAPGSWRAWGSDPAGIRAGAKEIAETAASLMALSAEVKRPILLGLEPEPRCTLETTDDVLDFFQGPLAEALAEVPAGAAAHVGVCYDVCHQSVMHEDIARSLARLDAASIPIVKLQASCALEVPDPSDPASRAALTRFDEPVYLHQVAAPDEAGVVHAAEDLGIVLGDESGAWLARRPWRVHFHVPVFRAASIPPLRTTRPDLVRALRSVIEHDLTRQIEIETYTWDVLPDAERAAGSGTDLVEALAREYESVLDELAPLGVRPA